MEALNTNLIRKLKILFNPVNYFFTLPTEKTMLVFLASPIRFYINQIIGRTLILKASLGKNLDRKTHPSPQSEACHSTIQLLWFCALCWDTKQKKVKSNRHCHLF